jgi:predicted transposase YbfD/YdcC
MNESAHTVMVRLFHEIPDPRMIGKISHKLCDILTIAVCAIIAGVESWTLMEDFGHTHESWFKTFLELPNGIPSHDTFGNVFAAMEPVAFEKAIVLWINTLVDGHTQGKQIAMDGKTLRRSFDNATGKAAVHMVSAYVHENHAVFGQLAVDEKSNEITAIPQLLETLKLKDATVTIDAMGCQREIAQKIIEKKGHYVLALKGNQGRLHADIHLYMEDFLAGAIQAEHDYHETVSKGHGRLETRKCWTLSAIDWLQDRHQWPGLASVITIESTRVVAGKSTTERRYYISSHDGKDAAKLATLVRNHWKIENQLHWILDVCFNEDSCRVRSKNAAENLSRVRKIALTLLKNEKTSKLGVKSKMKKAAYDFDYLLKVLGINKL